MFNFNDQCYYLFEQERISSFKSWKFNDNLPCNKFALAAAGFYKCSPDDASNDECACFYCGKTLGDWDAEDDPFKEHKSHTTNCMFINLERREAQLKVKEFIDLIEAWCIQQMDKKMERNIEQRTSTLNTLKRSIEAKFK